MEKFEIEELPVTGKFRRHKRLLEERVAIHPGCGYRLEATEDAHVIEYCDSLYDPEDDIPFTDF